MSGSGISWTICKQSAPRSRQTIMPTPHDSLFYRSDALPAAQPTASKHWRQIRTKENWFLFLPHCVYLLSISVVCPQAYLKSHMSQLHQIFHACCLQSWLSPPLTVLWWKIVHTRLLSVGFRLWFGPGPFCAWVQHANHSATEPPSDTWYVMYFPVYMCCSVDCCPVLHVLNFPRRIVIFSCIPRFSHCYAELVFAFHRSRVLSFSLKSFWNVDCLATSVINIHSVYRISCFRIRYLADFLIFLTYF